MYAHVYLLLEQTFVILWFSVILTCMIIHVFRFCHIVLKSADLLDKVMEELDKKPFGERGKLTVEKTRNMSHVAMKEEEKKIDSKPGQSNLAKNDDDNISVFKPGISKLTQETDCRRLIS